MRSSSPGSSALSKLDKEGCFHFLLVIRDSMLLGGDCDDFRVSDIEFLDLTLARFSKKLDRCDIFHQVGGSR
jgi:hypothetical protein